ncbi:MAG TPA: YceI family protein [Puia sp.]|nr:YceI family protein [Puia sp.]
MKKIIYPVLALLMLAGSAFTVISVQNWQIAEPYSISFTSNDASGIFKTFSGNIQFDEQDPSSARFNVSIDAASINTGNGLQNKHAKSEEWFDVTKYPVIRYDSRKVSKAGNGWLMEGDLEIHGVKKATSIPFTFSKTAKGAVFAGSFTVNRNDFKIGKPGGDVGELIKLDISVPVLKK